MSSRLSIGAVSRVETAVLLLIVSIAVTEIALWGRRQQDRASRRHGYLDGVVSAARMAAEGDSSAPAVVNFVSDQIIAVLDVDRCEFRTGRPGSHPRLKRDGTVTHDGHVIDVDRIGLPTQDVIEIVVESRGHVSGQFELVSAGRVVWPTLEQRLVAVTLAEQAGTALAADGETPRSSAP
jgi:hypothetical protein